MFFVCLLIWYIGSFLCYNLDVFGQQQTYNAVMKKYISVSASYLWLTPKSIWKACRMHFWATNYSLCHNCVFECDVKLNCAVEISLPFPCVCRTAKGSCSTTGPCSMAMQVQVQQLSPLASCSTTSPASSRPSSRSCATWLPYPRPSWGRSLTTTPTSRETPQALTDLWRGLHRCAGPWEHPVPRAAPRLRHASLQRRRSSMRVWW